MQGVCLYVVGCCLMIHMVVGSRQRQEVRFEIDTCAFCRSVPKSGNTMRRFKACQLFTLQKALTRSLKHTHRLQKEMEEKYHVPFDHVPVDKSSFLNTDDLIENVYTRLQKLFLLEQKALRYNLEYHLQTSVGTMSPHLQRLMCQLEAVLRAGHLYRDNPLGNRCIVSELIPKAGFSRTAGLNSIVDFVLHSKYFLELTIANIKFVLDQV